MTIENILKDVKTACEAFDTCADSAHDIAFDDYVTDFHMFLARTIEDTGDFTDSENYLEEATNKKFFLLVLYSFLYTTCETFCHVLHDRGIMEYALTDSGKMIVHLCDKYEEALIDNMKI